MPAKNKDANGISHKPLMARMLTTRDVAERLQVSISHVFSLINAKRLKAINITDNSTKIRRSLRITEEWLAEYIATSMAEMDARGDGNPGQGGDGSASGNNGNRNNHRKSTQRRRRHRWHSAISKECQNAIAAGKIKTAKGWIPRPKKIV